MQKQEHHEKFSFKSYFIPLTTVKAISWIIIIGLIVYANLLFNGFVWDDNVYLLNNADIRTLNLAYLFGPNTWNNGLYYRPLTGLYFSILYYFFNFNSFFYHLLQIALHITNSILLFFVFKKFINKYISFFLSLLFLVHPIQVEAVAFIATLSPLSFLFGLIALLISFKKIITPKRFVLILLFLLLSILVKETGFLFFLFILLYRIIFHFKRNEIALFIFVDIIAGSIYYSLRYFIGKTSLTLSQGTIVPIARLNFPERLENIPAIIFYYLKTFFYPVAFAIDQQWIVTRITYYKFYLPLLVDIVVVLLIVIFGIYLVKSHKKLFKPFLFFFFWFGLGLGFHLQLYALDMTVADRFFYYPIAGLLGMIGIGIAVTSHFYINQKRLQIIATIIALFIIIVLSVRTMERNSNWYNEITLYSHDLNIYDSMNDETNLGSDYAALKNYNEALNHYERAVVILPTELNLYDVGYIYEKIGNLKMAEGNYEKALTYTQYPLTEHKLIITTASGRLAYVYLLLGKNKRALQFIKQRLLISPEYGYLWEDLAISEYRMHNKKAAFLVLKDAKNYLSGNEIDYLYLRISNNTPINLIPLSSS
jgi:regulator of sirC expression with transglutaminase-like and TPR domain